MSLKRCLSVLQRNAQSLVETMSTDTNKRSLEARLEDAQAAAAKAARHADSAMKATRSAQTAQHLAQAASADARAVLLRVIAIVTSANASDDAQRAVIEEFDGDLSIRSDDAPDDGNDEEHGRADEAAPTLSSASSLTHETAAAVLQHAHGPPADGAAAPQQAAEAADEPAAEPPADECSI